MPLGGAACSFISLQSVVLLFFMLKFKDGILNCVCPSLASLWLVLGNAGGGAAAQIRFCEACLCLNMDSLYSACSPAEGGL